MLIYPWWMQQVKYFCVVYALCICAKNETTLFIEQISQYFPAAAAYNSIELYSRIAFDSTICIIQKLSDLNRSSLNRRETQD